MKKNKWINIIVTAAVLFSTSGCMDSFSDIKSNNKNTSKGCLERSGSYNGHTCKYV